MNGFALMQFIGARLIWLLVAAIATTAFAVYSFGSAPTHMLGPAESEAKRFKADLLHLQQIGAKQLRRPQFDSSFCQRVNKEPASFRTVSDRSADAIVSLWAGNEMAFPIYVGDGEFEWWINRLGYDKLLSLLLAYHETVHLTNRVATNCSPGSLALWVGGRIVMFQEAQDIPTPYHDIAKVASRLPLASTQRYKHYIEGDGRSQRNSLYVLLDELSAYVAAAEFEVQLAKILSVNGLDSLQPVGDINIGGAIEFKAYLLLYISRICGGAYKPTCEILVAEPVQLIIAALFERLDVVVRLREELPLEVRRRLQIPTAAQEVCEDRVYLELEQKIRKHAF